MPTDALDTYPFDEELISATPSQFDSQMRHLRENLHPISLQDLITHIDQGSPLPRNAIAVTFDDGFADTYRYAFPILKRYHIPATVFVSTGYVDSGEPFWFELVSYLVYRVAPGSLELAGGGPFPVEESRASRTAALRQIHSTLKDLPNRDRLEIIDRWAHRYSRELKHGASAHSQPLSWHQIIEMASSGISFGSHSVSHPNLTRLPDRDLGKELAESKRILESTLQRPIDTIAYPIGTPSAFDSRVIFHTRQHGFKLGLTYVSGANLLSKLDRFALQRHGIGLGMTSRYFRALTSLPSWLN